MSNADAGRAIGAVSSTRLMAAALKIIATSACEVVHMDKRPCFEHFPKDRHQWCWPCYARYVVRHGQP